MTESFTLKEQGNESCNTYILQICSCLDAIYMENYLIETGTFRFSHNNEKPVFSTSNFIRSLKLADFSGLTVTRNTSLAGSSDVSSFSFTPDWPVCELNINTHSFSPGIVYTLYLPAGKDLPSTLISLSILNKVASFAPVLHTLL